MQRKEKILRYSFRVDTLCAEIITFICLQKATLTNDTKDKEYTPHDLPQRQSVQPQETCSIARRAKRMRSEVSPICHFFYLMFYRLFVFFVLVF